MYTKKKLFYYRVALARAVYARTKYVLLDDPLSAVVCLSWREGTTGLRIV